VCGNAGTWHSTVKAWGSAHTQMGTASPAGGMVPVQAVYDLVGNLFNVQVGGACVLPCVGRRVERCGRCGAAVGCSPPSLVRAPVNSCGCVRHRGQGMRAGPCGPPCSMSRRGCGSGVGVGEWIGGWVGVLGCVRAHATVHARSGPELEAGWSCWLLSTFLLSCLHSLDNTRRPVGCVCASPQVPTDLDGPISRRLASIVVPTSSGLGVDMDALLLLLLSEYNAGSCPRSALLFPRRLTDGALFNLVSVCVSVRCVCVHKYVGWLARGEGLQKARGGEDESMCVH